MENPEEFVLVGLEVEEVLLKLVFLCHELNLDLKHLLYADLFFLVEPAADKQLAILVFEYFVVAVLAVVKIIENFVVIVVD